MQCGWIAYSVWHEYVLVYYPLPTRDGKPLVKAGRRYLFIGYIQQTNAHCRRTILFCCSEYLKQLVAKWQDRPIGTEVGISIVFSPHQCVPSVVVSSWHFQTLYFSQQRSNGHVDHVYSCSLVLETEYLQIFQGINIVWTRVHFR